MKKRKYTREFKLSILNELNSKQVVEVCREHNLNPSMVTRWKKEFKESPNKAFSGNGNFWKRDAELEKYKRLVGELYAEIDFFKKTISYLNNLITQLRYFSSNFFFCFNAFFFTIFFIFIIINQLI